MSTATAEPDTLADVVRALGDVPLDRILWHPRPGAATEADLLRTRGTELVDGMLVRKATGVWKGLVEAVIGVRLLDHVKAARLGAVTMASGPYRVGPGLVRRPDAAFICWHRVLDDAGRLPDIAPAAPDVVVEIPTPENTPAELTRKYGEYFQAGAKRVWEVDSESRTVTVYTEPDSHQILTELDTLDGGAVLPGFALPLADLFDDPQLNPRP